MAVIAWPFRSILRAVSSIVVAVVTAVAIGYVTSEDDVLLDKINEVSGGDPILVRQFEPDASLVKRAWALPETLTAERVPRSMGQRDFRELVTSTKAVLIGVSEVELTVEGNRHDSVIIERITARVVDQGDAPRATIVAPPKFGGPNPKIELGFDLDGADKRARTPGPNGALGEIFGKKDYLEIRKDEKLVFSFHGVAKRPHVYKWVIDFTLQIGDQHPTMTVGAAAPYAVAGPVDSYGNYYDRGEWQIEPATADQICPGGCTVKADLWAKI